MENLKDFLSMSEEEKIRRIKSLDPEEVIRILTSVGTNALSAELLNQLAVAYNNSIQPEKAMETLDLVQKLLFLQTQRNSGIGIAGSD